MRFRVQGLGLGLRSENVAPRSPRPIPLKGLYRYYICKNMYIYIGLWL